MLREELANLCHEQWSGWMEYLFDKGTFNDDGTWTMPKWAVERWKRQLETPYAELSTEDKDSDRAKADKFLPFLEDGFVTLDMSLTDEEFLVYQEGMAILDKDGR